MLRLIGTTLVVLLTVPPAYADEPPRFNIETMCHAAPALLPQDGDPYAGCMRDERAAQVDLTQKWASFSPEHRRSCVSETRLGSPSYADVLTCIQMAADADALPGEAPVRRAKGGK
jgi:hypothetical protein